jgi:hypothetical protein
MEVESLLVRKRIFFLKPKSDQRKLFWVCRKKRFATKACNVQHPRNFGIGSANINKKPEKSFEISGLIG